MSTFAKNVINMSETFIFPDSLHDLTLTRLGVDEKAAKSFLANLDKGSFQGRITGIDLKCKDELWTMRFYLDGRKSGKCFIEKDMRDWMEAGLVTIHDIAVHFSKTIKPGFGRILVQQSLFD